MRIRVVGEVIRRIGLPLMAADPQELAESRDLTDALTKLPPKQAAAIVQRRTDKGDPNRCPVWPLHQIYSDAATCDWVKTCL